MHQFQYKFLLTFLFAELLLLISSSSIRACTYQATIAGNHVNFAITSDIDKLGVIQYIRQSGSALVTKMYGADVGLPWTYYADPSCNINTNNPVGCRQIRWGTVGEGAFWQWYDWTLGQYHVLPGATWGMDFNSPPTYGSLGIEYGIIPGTSGENWKFCNRTGDVPIPVSKVFFVPGLGASWNPEALLNCTPDPNPSHWSLAPYAESIYNPLLTALSNTTWKMLLFYYDWRQDIRNNDNLLADYINQNTVSGEKINLVGHSMGGLLGREYLEASSGGKLASLLTVGSPHKGSPLAYPVWSGGDVWQDNFLVKIAMTLYLRHCGKLGGFSTDRETVQNVFPSIQNLLPITSYLKGTKSFTPPEIADMDANNEWLVNKTSTWPNIAEVKVKSLSGTGFNTLLSIPVREPTKHDISLGNWIDGKPVGKEFSTEGDGTVLLSSSQINSTDGVINQTHSGLVASSEGICKILEFLGGEPCTLPTAAFSEPNSALVIIGYPSSFWITDQNGNSQKDKNGMISFINPKSGLFKLNLLPKSNNTLFIVAQFLPSGDIKYKEYNFKGLGPIFKTLKFDLQNPQEDILNP